MDTDSAFYEISLVFVEIVVNAIIVWSWARDFGLLFCPAVYGINLDDVQSVASGCCKQMLGTIRKLDVQVRTVALLMTLYDGGRYAHALID